MVTAPNSFLAHPPQTCHPERSKSRLSRLAQSKDPGDDRPATSARTTLPKTPSDSGFTLIELMIVMIIIGILATIAIPAFIANVKHAREAVLHEDLATMRGAIEQYTYDKQKAPQGGDDLVQSGYLREIPLDPMTHRRDTWIFDQGSTLTTIDETQGGIDNVHSGSQDISTEGTTYNTW